MRFLNFTAVLSCLLLLNTGATLSAHEGHGSPAVQDGLLHYLVNPSHAIPLVIVSSVVVWMVKRLLGKVPQQTR
jgi:hypothetical protein